MVKLSGAFSRLGKAKLMVVGDILFDTYTIGKARRISPEAPVAVIHVQNEDHRPGGAGNVMLNLTSMGADIMAVSRVGEDHHGQMMLQALQDEGINTQGIVVQPGYATPIKNRIIADNQQIVRVDHEEISPIPELLEQQIIDQLPKLLEDVSVIAISDYGKGFLSYTLIQKIIQLAKKRNIPIISDPKGVDFTKYRGTTIIKPNLSETYAAANLPPDAPLDEAVSRILETTQADVLMVTRSEDGITLFHRDGRQENFPVQVREVKDVTGAGDTVLAMIACALANGLPLDEGVQLSNIAAGIAIEKLGCARVTLSEIARRLLATDVVNKVYDEKHLFALQQALQERSFTLLGLNTETGLSNKLFSAIREASKKEGQDLLVYVFDSTPDQESVNLLASLHDVNFMILEEHTLRNLCREVQPKDVFIVTAEGTVPCSFGEEFFSLTPSQT